MATKKFTLNHAARCKCCGKFYSEPEPIRRLVLAGVLDGLEAPANRLYGVPMTPRPSQRRAKYYVDEKHWTDTWRHAKVAIFDRHRDATFSAHNRSLARIGWMQYRIRYRGRVIAHYINGKRFADGQRLTPRGSRG